MNRSSIAVYVVVGAMFSNMQYARVSKREKKSFGFAFLFPRFKEKLRESKALGCLSLSPCLKIKCQYFDAILHIECNKKEISKTHTKQTMLPKIVQSPLLLSLLHFLALTATQKEL